MANLLVAEMADAAVVLVADIDRGGAFAHLYGTWSLIGEKERQRVGGFILNKFRGDASLLAPAPEQLEELTGVPLLGVVPWLEHGLPDEDGAGEPTRRGRPVVSVVRYPTASNLDEFRALEQVADVVWVRKPDELGAATFIVLPGSKHVSGDLGWLVRNGFDRVLRERVRAGARVLGICGGLQMLGTELTDEGGVDGDGDGLELLEVTTSFSADKVTRETQSRFANDLPTPWSARRGIAVHGYEIRHGSSRVSGETQAALPDDLGFTSGSVLGVYLHGLLESPTVVRALFGAIPTTSLESTFEELADVVDSSLDRALLDRLAGLT
jgi:adenosylcobyric acid synthase